VDRALSLESNLVTHSASGMALVSPRSRTNLPLVPLLARCLQVPVRLRPCRRHPAPWCAPQARATIAPINRMSCTSCSTSRLSSLARDHTCRRTFSCCRTYSLPFRMFCFSSFILDSSLLSLAVPFRPCHRTSTFTAPFDLAPAVALRYYVHSLLSF
jgi:hypothetical protein